MRSKNTSIGYLIVFLAIIKITVSLSFFDFHHMHSDEERNYNIVTNYLNGDNYSVSGPNNTFIRSAFHGSFTIFLYKFLINHNIKKETWIIFYYILSNIFYMISLLYFFKISKFFLSEQLSLLSTFLYGVYPSVLFYLGALFFYENLALYFLIIVLYFLLKWMKESTISKSSLVVCASLITLSCLLRGQLIFIYLIILSIYIVINFHSKTNRHSLIRFSILLLSLILLTHYPILEKNKKLFGAYILSTQPGFEILQGHSAVAKGGWIGQWEYPNNELYIYAHENIPGLDSMDEYHSSLKRAALGFKWMYHHPLADIQLEIKKLAIYFFPYNFDQLPNCKKINPINAFAHLGFGIFCIYFLFYKRNHFSRELLIITLPILGSILICICFFTGYRWRFYADPFMILTSIIVLNHLGLFLKTKKKLLAK